MLKMLTKHQQWIFTPILAVKGSVTGSGALLRREEGRTLPVALSRLTERLAWALGRSVLEHTSRERWQLGHVVPGWRTLANSRERLRALRLSRQRQRDGCVHDRIINPQIGPLAFWKAWTVLMRKLELCTFESFMADLLTWNALTSTIISLDLSFLTPLPVWPTFSFRFRLLDLAVIITARAHLIYRVLDHSSTPNTLMKSDSIFQVFRSSSCESFFYSFSLLFCCSSWCYFSPWATSFSSSDIKRVC